MHRSSGRQIGAPEWASYQAVVANVDHYAFARATVQDAATARALRLLTTDGPTPTKQAA